MIRLSNLKALVPAAGLALFLGACAVPAAIMPEREVAVQMPVAADGTTVVSGMVDGYDGPAGTLDRTLRVRGNDARFASGTIDAGGNFTLQLLVPPAGALLPVRDAWGYEADIISSNPQARLAFLYVFAVHEGRERPSGWIGMATLTDPDDEQEVGDMEAAYVYASQPTRVRINELVEDGGHRYVSDLNLARGWNRVLTTVTSITADVVTLRETVDYTTDVPWAYVENED